MTALLKWLGGSLALVSAALYATGFMALQAHLNLLGIAPLVNVNALACLIEGARFAYTLPVFLLVGVVVALPVLVTFAVAANIARKKPRILLSLIALALTGALVITIWVLLPTPGLLYSTSTGNWVTSFYRRNPTGRQYLYVLYAAYVALVSAFGILAAFWNNERKRWTLPGWRYLEIWSAGTLAVLVFLAPVLFGLYTTELKFPRVVVQPAKDAAIGVVDGWLLNRTVDADQPLIIYAPGNGRDPPATLVIAKNSYASLRISDKEYIRLPGGAK